uniref:Putative host-nuclease inhibitor protein n=1 Tax=viral metagenome TaxID=1070528 RepID=A0A6M3IQF3_9ZZZZ
MPITDELDKLQKEIDTAKKDAAIFEGRLQESMKRLKEDFGLESVEEATKEIGRLKTEIVSLEADVEKGITSLKENYQW